MAQEGGVAALRVRAVARRANVNLGMFHYHFKSRKAFLRRLLQETYEDFFARLSLESSGTGGPRERLRRALLTFGRFARDNRRLFLALLGDALQGDRLTLDFAGRNIPRHAGVILGLVQEGQEAGELRRLPGPFVLSFVFPALAGPGAVLSILEKAGARRPFGRPLAELETTLLSDRALEDRIDLLLTALAVPKGGRR